MRVRFMPWGGLALGTFGYFLAHQIGSDSSFQDCAAAIPALVIFGTLLGFAIIAFGAFCSWTVFAASEEAAARRLIATVSLMAAALFEIGVILPLIASMIIPRCWA